MRASPVDDRDHPHAPPADLDERFRAAWERVRIEEVEVRRAAVPGALAAVRASTYLNGFLPVDVALALSLGGEAREEPLWCAHSYQNGRYDFELHLADERLARASDGRLVLRPARAQAGAANEVRSVVRRLRLARRRR